MHLNRRHFLSAAAATPALASSAPPAWTPEWDRAAIEGALERGARTFDPQEAMIRRRVGAEYRYHTNLRSVTAHPTRESFRYAQMLLEAGGGPNTDRAHAILDRVLALQDTDPASQWYGLWGYYLEEPASKMSPADWNWADFNGATLLEIALRRGSRLGDALLARVREAIRHAAVSVRRRNVAMTYTNIAVQGTFVTLAAAELLQDADLLKYALDRLNRFARTVDATGSFTEYNSPTYGQVAIENLTRMRMMVRHAEARDLASRIHSRAWLHLARRWYAPARQLGGPMSRCYSTDIGKPAWLQKALGGAIPFLTLEEVRKGAAGEVSLVDYRCPKELVGDFLNLPALPRQHREVFLPAPEGVRPVQGTSYRTFEFCLGSVNRGSFWVQSRPLLAYWPTGGNGSAAYLQARVLKDDYDLASALLYSVQQEEYVLGAVLLRHPGGDKHPLLDPLPNPFACRRLRLRLDLAGTPWNAPVLVNGAEAGLGSYLPGSGVAIQLGAPQLWFRTLAAGGAGAGTVSLAREDGMLTLSVELLPPSEAPQQVRLPQPIGVVFTLAMGNGSPSLEDFYRIQNARPARLNRGARDDIADARWKAPAGELRLQFPMRSGPLSELDAAFRELIDGKPVPVVRLSEERLVPGEPPPAAASQAPW